MLNTSEYVLTEMLRFYCEHKDEYTLDVVDNPNPTAIYDFPPNAVRGVKQAGMIILVLRK